MIVCEGGIGLIKVSQDEEDGVVLSGLSVLPEFRHKGIGTKLMKEAERIVQDEVGEEKICLCVESWNKNLIGWYERLGYSVLGPSEYGYTDMIKNLDLNGKSSSLDLQEEGL